jgi:hypothetical protein
MGTVTADHVSSLRPGTIRIMLSGSGQFVDFPLPAGKAMTAIAAHSLQGRLLSSAAEPARSPVLLPGMPRSGIVIVSCTLSDGSTISRKVPLVR